MKLHNYRNLYLSRPITPKRAEELNLRSVMGEDNIKCYKYRFPVCFWEKNDNTKVPTLFCTFTIDAFDWHVKIDVTTLDNNYYADFYCAVITNKNKDSYPMLCEVHKIIQKEVQKLGIVQIEDKEVQDNDRSGSKKNSRSDSRPGKPIKRAPQRQGSKRDTTSRTKVPRQNIQKRSRRKGNISQGNVSNE